MITTHVLDLVRGAPGTGITVTLDFLQPSDGEWSAVGLGVTDGDGRLQTLTEGWTMVVGTYRLTFDIASYQRAQSPDAAFFPYVQITFNVVDTEARLHVPLLLSPFGYSTYRGS
jgi:5-hydroxyisourate hydrolase